MWTNTQLTNSIMPQCHIAYLVVKSTKMLLGVAIHSYFPLKTKILYYFIEYPSILDV